MKTLLTIAVARGLALFLGAFSLLNVLGEFRSPGFDANLWWIDLRALPSPMIAQLILTSAAVFLIAFAIRPRMATTQRIATAVFVSGLLLATFWNSCRFYLLLADGSIQTTFPIPFSLFTSLALLLLLVALWLPVTEVTNGQHRWVVQLSYATSVTICLVGFPLAQMVCFGLTDYRRPADAIVVFGAKALASGEPSGALDERVRTSCELYHAGLGQLLVFSGGPGDGSVHETESMRRVALRQGVPDTAILLDPDGLNTQATVRNTSPMFQAQHVQRVIAVSHFYHLPRIKMTYRRFGWDVYTVPAKRRYPMPGLPRYMTREVVALWAYYLRPLTETSKEPRTK